MCRNFIIVNHRVTWFLLKWSEIMYNTRRAEVEQVLFVHFFSETPCTYME